MCQIDPQIKQGADVIAENYNGITDNNDHKAQSSNWLPLV